SMPCAFPLPHSSPTRRSSDLGAMKYGHRDIRNVLERSSARETTARVSVAGVAKRLLVEFGVTILSHVTEIGGVRIAADLDVTWRSEEHTSELQSRVDLVCRLL